jgi:hypothetical protein
MGTRDTSAYGTVYGWIRIGSKFQRIQIQYFSQFGSSPFENPNEKWTLKFYFFLQETENLDPGARNLSKINK